MCWQKSASHCGNLIRFLHVVIFRQRRSLTYNRFVVGDQTICLSHTLPPLLLPPENWLIKLFVIWHLILGENRKVDRKASTPSSSSSDVSKNQTFLDKKIKTFLAVITLSEHLNVYQPRELLISPLFLFFFKLFHHFFSCFSLTEKSNVLFDTPKPRGAWDCAVHCSMKWQIYSSHSLSPLPRKRQQKFPRKKSEENFIESEQNFQSTKALTSLWLCEQFSFSLLSFLYSWWQFFLLTLSLLRSPFFSFSARSQRAEEKFQFSPRFLSLSFVSPFSIYGFVSLFLNSIKTICDNLLDEGLSSFSKCQFGVVGEV